ncbi:STAM-binding protein-like [Microtus oregoni]|uniref:STAM-binding protein-like n=1 Tax=Microtus oregoni TaxID=111838 RepID=UPI001BB0EB33|nr:STAM-binding protein-like [Microtus oregoni]
MTQCSSAPPVLLNSIVGILFPFFMVGKRKGFCDMFHILNYESEFADTSAMAASLPITATDSDILKPWLTDQQCCPGITGPFSARAPNKNRSTIGRHEDITLPPQERFQTLSLLGQNMEISKKLPLLSYVHLKKNILQMAEEYEKQGLLQEAFITFHKFLTLFVEKLRKGPEYDNILSQRQKSKIKKCINKAFEKAETLKIKILERYGREYEEYLADKKKRQEVEKDKAFLEDIRSILKDSTELTNQSSPQTAVVYDSQGAFTETDCITSKSGPPCAESKEEKSPIQNTKGLLPVVLPKDLCQNFLRSAWENTKRKRETCGVLCGKLVNDKYIISHIIIPMQNGGPDYCQAENEEEILFLEEELGLITLGWIHTHPTQPAFLSSVDVHTHFCYQQMLPESIAVVCSPKYKQTGIFTLTPFGLEEVSLCPRRGFHSHRHDSVLFSDCSHVIIQKSSVTITDLR